MNAPSPVATIEPRPAPKMPQVPVRARRLIISLGDKGGTSKSFVLRKLAEMHLAANTAGLMLVDGDQTVGTLFRYYGERDVDGAASGVQSSRGVQTFSLHGTIDARDRFVNDLLRRDADLVIADLPATSLTKLREISQEYDFAAAVTQAGYRLTIVAPITPYDDSVLDLQEAIAFIDPPAYDVFERLFDEGASPAMLTAARAKLTTRADYVAIVNLGLAEDRHDFTIWDAPDSLTHQLLRFVGGVELEFPRLRPRVAALLAKYRLTFQAGESANSIPITDRSRLEKWNAMAASTLRAAGAVLGF